MLASQPQLLAIAGQVVIQLPHLVPERFRLLLQRCQPVLLLHLLLELFLA